MKKDRMLRIKDVLRFWVKLKKNQREELRGILVAICKSSCQHTDTDAFIKIETFEDGTVRCLYCNKIEIRYLCSQDDIAVLWVGYIEKAKRSSGEALKTI